MGGLACDMVCEVSHSLSMLLSLSSVEAVSFGATGLAGMKVTFSFNPDQMFFGV